MCPPRGRAPAFKLHLAASESLTQSDSESEAGPVLILPASSIILYEPPSPSRSRASGREGLQVLRLVHVLEVLGPTRSHCTEAGMTGALTLIPKPEVHGVHNGY